MVAAEQAGDTGYDVLNLDVTWTAEFAAAGLVKPLADAARSDFLPNAWGTVGYRDKIWAIPFNSDAGLLFYRTDAGFAGPPRTWEELQTDLLIVHKPQGYITQLAQYEGLTVNVLEAVWNAGGELVGGNGKVGSSVRIQQGLDQLKQEQGWMPDSAARAHEAESLQAFAQGQVLFMRGWPYMYDVLIADGLKPGVHFNVARLPGDYGPGYSVLGGQNLAVAAHSRNPSLARQLIDFLTSRESERCLLEGGFAAARTSAYTTNAHCPLSPMPGAPANESGSTPTPSGGLPPYSDVLYAALTSAKPRPTTPYYAAFTQFVQADVARFFRDPRTDVVTDMAKDLNHVLTGSL
jgi:multiple sugar transport system substrate-binding protein